MVKTNKIRLFRLSKMWKYVYRVKNNLKDYAKK